MAVVEYRIHFARPDGFAVEDLPIVRLILEAGPKHAVWVWKFGDWRTAHTWTSPPDGFWLTAKEAKEAKEAEESQRSLA